MNKLKTLFLGLSLVAITSCTAKVSVVADEAAAGGGGGEWYNGIWATCGAGNMNSGNMDYVKAYEFATDGTLVSEFMLFSSGDGSCTGDLRVILQMTGTYVIGDAVDGDLVSPESYSAEVNDYLVRLDMTSTTTYFILTEEGSQDAGSLNFLNAFTGAGDVGSGAYPRAYNVTNAVYPGVPITGSTIYSLLSYDSDDQSILLGSVADDEDGLTEGARYAGIEDDEFFTKQ